MQIKGCQLQILLKNTVQSNFEQLPAKV